MKNPLGPVAPSLAYKAVNFGLFQIVYFACVLGAARGHVWLGPAAGFCLLPLNLLFVAPGSRAKEVGLWLTVGAVGFVVDSCLLSAGLIGFTEPTRISPEAALSAFLVPPWIVTLWVAVGATLRSSLAWLRGRPALAFALGAISGPFSFWSGARLEAAVLPKGMLSVGALALEYALLVPMLLWFAHRTGETSPPPVSGGTSPESNSDTDGHP